MKASQPTRIYKCGRCGLPKKGHVCTGFLQNASGTSGTSSGGLFAIALNQQEDEDDIEDDDDTPPPPPALLQLRPLSEVSKRLHPN